MAKDTIEQGNQFPEETTAAQLSTALVNSRDLFLSVIDTNGLKAINLPEGFQADRFAVVDGDLFLVSEDGQIVVLLSGAENNYVILSAGIPFGANRLQDSIDTLGEWDQLGDLPRLTIDQLANLSATRPGTGEQEEVRVGDPLIGLIYNPLLPPTDYSPELQRDERYFGNEVFDDGGVPEPGNNTITLSGLPVTRETDAPVVTSPASIIQFDIEQADLGEAVTLVTFEVTGLPLGTSYNLGQITSNGSTATLVFSGSEAEFSALTLTYPTDFSTQSRTDAPPGPLQATVTIETNFLGSSRLDFEITVLAEGDAVIDDTLPDTVPDETDAPTTFKPSELLKPQVTDIDGSENYETLELIITGLPGGSTLTSLGIVVPAGATAAINNVADGSSTLTVTMVASQVADIQNAYDGFELTLPADFSTDNRSDLTSGTQLPVSLTLNIQTDEDASAAVDGPNDGTVSVTRVLDIGFEEDIDLSGPPRIDAEEDAGNPNASIGVDIDLGIEITIDDRDGSETEDPSDLVFAGTVEVRLDSLPAGTSVNVGILNGTVWTGTVPEAEALILSLPPNYSGQINTQVTVTTREGSETIEQLIVVSPTSDVEIVGNIITQETDAPLDIRISDFVEIRISDPDEELAQFELTISSLPAGTRLVDENGNDIGSIRPGGGSTVDLVLNYNVDTSGFDPAGVRLIFPTDFSTENPPTTLTANLTVTTRENGLLTTPVSDTFDIIISAEGDVYIDDTQPDTVPDETDATTLITPSDLLEPIVTDADGSESLETLTFTIEGLPAGSTPASLAISPPAGAVLSIVDNPATGAATLTLTMNAASVADVLAAYNAFELTLPQDFSTANRADLTNGDVALPLTFTLAVQTDEDQDPNTDTAMDGTATATRVVDIDFELDADLSAPLEIRAQEDGGVPGSSAGVVVDLQIDIDITDIDGSETAAPGTPFSASVSIQFVGIPAGTNFPTGSFDPSTGVWTGTVADAEALQLGLPGDYNGTISSTITVTTPEGQVATPQVIIVEPVTDVVIGGEVIANETDAPVEVLLSAFINVQIPVDEVIQTLTFSLNGLPPGTQAVDGTGTAVGTFTPGPGNTFDFLFEYTGTGPDPRDVRLIFPTDYSTENPLVNLVASLDIVTDQGSTSGLIPVTVNFEGDVEVDDATVNLSETDDVVLVTPSDFILPRATDLDGSESVDLVIVVFNALPPGTQVSTDGGATFIAASPTLNFVGDLATYQNLVIELPADFSTQNPASALEAQIVAVTDEGGVDDGVLTINLSAEGDLALSGPGSIVLTENDVPGDTDEDNTTSAPLEFRPADAVTGQATDADGSEAIATVDVVVNGLPPGTQYSLNGGVTFLTSSAGNALTLSGLSLAEYGNLVIRLPDDFSTTTPITGSATFTTDEALLAGETDTGPNDGIETGTFTVTVNSEQDVEITAQDITVIEDLGQPIPLNLDVGVTDIDGSESITSITLDFANLPNGDTVLSDGTVLNAGNTQWSGTVAELQTLAVTSLPTHYSGVIDITITVDTDEGNPTVTTESFYLNVTPVAEPTIVLSVDDSTPNVDERGPDNFIVDEDTSFLLLIDAETPDQDGSESLTQIVIENIPPGWVPDTGGAVDLALFEQGAAQIASATISGTTLTIALVPGVTDFDGALRVEPLGNDDRDVQSIVGAELAATVTSVDTAPTLPTDTQTETDSVDVDVDAIVDGLNVTATDVTVNENRNGRRRIDLDITGTALADNDGSETISSLDLTITVATASEVFDPSDTSQLELRVSDPALAGFITIAQSGSTADTVSYTLTPAAGATQAQFTAALESLETVVPQHFSGLLTIDGALAWNETTTGDVEDDLSDNFNSSAFQITQTVNPRAEADLTASVFVLAAAEVATGSPTSVSASVEDGSVSGSEILTLLESTADGSGPGQVGFFVGLDASTPDTDGSEELSALVIGNVPSDWIADFLTGNTVDAAAFFASDGTAPLSQSELDKIDSATYDASTGELTINFAPDVTSFAGSIQLQPSLYEDYDIDRNNTDPFTSAGDFFGDDLTITLTTLDDNTVTTDGQVSDATFDVDVDPVNNFAVIVTLPEGNEAVIDAAGGVWQIPFSPIIQDQDGSEEVTAVVLRQVPDGITIFVPDPANPGGPKIPALLTEVNTPPGFNTWSLENGGWLEVEARGIPLHFAGPVSVNVEVVTTEADGGGTRVTTLPETLYIDPIVDGGDPSETYATLEDLAVFFPIDGNLIDNPTNSPGSPEAILDVVVISNIIADSGGRVPQFFDGPPNDPASVELFPIFSGPRGTLQLTVAQASTLWVVPGQDSNEDFVFDISLIYFETLDPTQSVVATGTATLTVKGIADDPIITVQDEASFPQNPNLIDPIFRPGEVVDGVENSVRIYGYAGFDTAPFLLDKRLSIFTIDSGIISQNEAITFSQNVTPLTGEMTEILVPQGAANPDFDGSETIYYIITGVDPATAFTNATPIDATGTSYVVTEAELPNLTFVPADVSQPTYYDMTFTAIVVEDDANLPSFAGLTPEQTISAIDALPGGATVSEDFTIVVIPDPDGGGGNPCTPEQDLPLPVLELIGSGDEDTEIAFKIKLTPNPPFYDSIDDLSNLPNGVTGDFGLGITLPPGSSLSSDPPGAVLFDPVTGLYAIDLALLGVDPNDPTQTAGSILFTPPEHQSSPANPFDPNETFGPDDPYDNLNQLEYFMLLNNFTCGTSDSATSSFNITINPVVDGPEITTTVGNSALEDTPFLPGIKINGIDPGEKLTGDIIVEIDGANGGQLLDGNGNPIPGTPVAGGFIAYTVTPAQLATVQITTNQHYSGPLEYRVTATTEDIDGSTLSNTITRTVDIIPVADTPIFDFDQTPTDPDTGQPYVDLSGPTPVITIIEDVPFTLDSVIDADSPDQDGSEEVTIVLSGVPDYLSVTGPSSGFIDNGDGSFTITQAAWAQVQIKLKNEHARTPDALDPTIPSQIPLTLTVNTLELANSDSASGSVNFIVQVRPDADVPTVSATATPTTGAEDDGTVYTLSISGNTPDPHETVSFEITVPPGGKILVDGVEQPIVGGVVTLAGAAGASTNGNAFLPAGVVTFEPPPDFAGDVSLDVVAITTDSAVGGGFSDTEASPPAMIDLTITPTPDLVLTVTDPDVDLMETDSIVSYSPAGDFDIQVTDTDGSEFVDSVTYTILGVPVGATYQIGTGAPIAVTGDLVFTGSLTDFNQLQVNFPTDFATNGTSLNGSLQATTNEGGNQTGNFTIDVDGELDLTVTIDPMPQSVPQNGNPIQVDFGITATVTDTQATPSETLEQVVVQFTAPLPAGTTVSAGNLSSDRQILTLTRGATSPADFALLVATLAITLPAEFAGAVEGTITVSTNHGSGPSDNFIIEVNDQPVVSGPVSVSSREPVFFIDFATLMSNASDPDQPLSVLNVATTDPDVTIDVQATGVQITVPNAYVGTPVMTYDIVDSGPGPASTSAQANLDIDTLQMETTGTTISDPGGAPRDLLDDVTGAVGGNDIAIGTSGNDGVVLSAASPYAEIEGFSLLDGNDFIDLSASTKGYDVDLGTGADWAIGSSGNDTITGGEGSDTLEGGTGSDIFVMTELTMSDVITDYEGPVAGDQVDLTALVSVDPVNLGSEVTYDNTSGELDVSGTLVATINAAGGGFAGQVEVIFNDASGAQQTAVI